MTSIHAILKIVAAAGMFLLTTTAGAAWWSGHYTDEDDFFVEIPGMLDFDQVRAGRGSHTPGLPGEGEMYCVPTSTMNLLAYLATNGYPNLDPGTGNWDDETDQDAYDTITRQIDDLGVLMNTDTSVGTYSSDWLSGTREWLETRHSPPSFLLRMIAQQYISSSTTETTLAQAASLARRGVVNLCYGFYSGSYSVDDPSDPLATGTAGTRNGGHCVSYSSADSLSERETALEVMDPSHESTGDDDYSQSTMQVRDWMTDDVEWTDVSWITSAIQTLTSYGEVRLIDEIQVIRPAWTLSVTISGELVRTRLDEIRLRLELMQLSEGELLIDARVRSDQQFVAMVTRDAGAGQVRALLLDLRTGEMTQLAQAGTVNVAFSRFQELYVSRGRRVSRTLFPTGDPEEIGAAQLERAPRAMEWIDTVDELWALDGQAGRIVALGRALGGARRVLEGDGVFAQLAADPAVRMTAVVEGRVALLSPALGTVAVFAEDEGRLVLQARYDNARRAKDLSSTDSGNIVVVLAEGDIVEFEQDGLGRLGSTPAPTDGMSSAGLIELGRSSTNFDPKLHSGRTNGGRR